MFLVGEAYYHAGLKNNQGEFFRQSANMYENDILALKLSDIQKAEASYMLGLNYQKLGEYLKAVEAFENAIAIETDPNNANARNLHWLWLLVADCYEKLKVEGEVDASDADTVIEAAYQDVVANFSSGGNLERALMRLGEINMEKHKYATACAYFQWLLNETDSNDPHIADINCIVARYRSTTDE